MAREKLPRAYVTYTILNRENPRTVFEKIHKFIQEDSQKYEKSRIETLGDMIISYHRPQDFRRTTVALTDACVQVRIRIFGNYRFEGYVLSLDEFKLIWERIL